MLPKILVSLRVMSAFFTSEIRIAGCCILAGFLIERLAKRTPASTDENRMFNYTCTACYFLFDSTAGMLISFWFAGVVDRLHGRFLIFHDRPGIGFALFLSLLLSIGGDFAYYWLHRLQHASPWLWATHQLHHSDECVNVTSTFRLHWLENPSRIMCAMPLAVLFPNPHEVIPMAYVLAWAHTFLNHVNAPIGFGWFNRLIVNARTHRIHHSTQPEHIDKNFAGVFSLWDVIFRTYVHPKKGEYPRTGLVSPASPTSVSAAMGYPFKEWRNLYNASQRRRRLTTLRGA